MNDEEATDTAEQTREEEWRGKPCERTRGECYDARNEKRLKGVELDDANARIAQLEEEVGALRAKESPEKAWARAQDQLDFRGEDIDIGPYQPPQPEPSRCTCDQTCDVCGGRFSHDATRCPSCGDRYKMACHMDNPECPEHGGRKEGSE